MAYRTILTYFEQEKQFDALFNMAKGAMGAAGDHLIGIYVVPLPVIYVASEAVSMYEIFAAERAQHVTRAKQLKATFEKKIAEEGLAGEWRTVMAQQTDRAQTLLDHARTADLVILSRADPNDDQKDSLKLVENVVLQSGRPTIIVPHDWKQQSFAEEILVAWNGEREAAVAVTFALPLLVAAKKVHIHWINPPEELGPDVATPGSELGKTLARHGANVSVGSSSAKGHSTGAQILAEVRLKGCDMLIMGGYGHSRFREKILGGATRNIFDNMPVPVLMAH